MESNELRTTIIRKLKLLPFFKKEATSNLNYFLFDQVALVHSVNPKEAVPSYFLIFPYIEKISNLNKCFFTSKATSEIARKTD